jgi:hypothetical protein
MIGTTGTETELDFRSTEEAITVKTPQQRLKTIELTLTPKQVVVVWLRNAIRAATFEDGARRTPPPRKVSTSHNLSFRALLCR